MASPHRPKAPSPGRSGNRNQAWLVALALLGKRGAILGMLMGAAVSGLGVD